MRIKYSVIAIACVVLALASFGSLAGNDSSPGGLTATSAGLRLADAGGANVLSDGQTDQPTQSPSSGAAALSGFRTRYAHFEPARFSDLPGWHEDNLAEAWKAFRGSCAALASRSAWSAMCQRSTEVRTRNDEIRHFFEREFVLYQIRNQDRSPAGIITGYYEPLLNGSRRRMGKYIHPVYGVPDDLLYVDSRSLPRSGAGGPHYARVEGRMVIPSARSLAAGATRDEVRVLDVGRARPDIRDKKLRVRVDGDRIVPYYTRGQIEQGVLDAAQVIVWVDSAAALYSMQVQGSGKVRLQDGKIVRLAYAEQNGHPFLPPVQGSLRPGQASVPIPQTRGIPLRTWLASDQASGNGGEQIDPAAPTTRGARSKAAAGGNQGTNAARERDSQEMSSEVARVVDLLLKGAGTKVAAKDNSTLSTDSRKTSSGIDKNSTSTTISRKPSSRIDNNAVNTSDAMNLSSLHTLPGLTAFSSDPSYVSRWFSRGRQPSRESRCETGRSAHRRQL